MKLVSSWLVLVWIINVVILQGFQSGIVGARSGGIGFDVAKTGHPPPLTDSSSYSQYMEEKRLFLPLRRPPPPIENKSRNWEVPPRSPDSPPAPPGLCTIC